MKIKMTIEPRKENIYAFRDMLQKEGIYQPVDIPLARVVVMEANSSIALYFNQVTNSLEPLQFECWDDDDLFIRTEEQMNIKFQ